MEPIDKLELAPDGGALVYEHGWQSWSPTATYGLDDSRWRPTSDRNRTICYRPDSNPGPEVFWGEGLLAIDLGDGSGVRIYSAKDARSNVPSIQVEVTANQAIVSASGPVATRTEATDIDTALARWADDFAADAGVTEVRRAPTIWCSWYQYFTSVSESDIIENMTAIERLGLPVDVIQLDDGYQTALGDWLELTDRFESLVGIASRIKDSGYRAGIWLAPFLVAPESQLARKHPDWLVSDGSTPVHAGHNWGQDLFALDTTHPAALEWIAEVFSTLHRWGYDFFKIDFVYAAALQGRRYEDTTPVEAYRRGMSQVRAAIGSSYLLGCGAPILPTVGLVDAMRVSPDTHVLTLPEDGDRSQPAIASAMMTGRARAFQHGRFWVNDPDCLIARPYVVDRADWAEHIRRFGGLRGSSDRIADLDEWGIETTRELLSHPSAEPFITSRGTT